MSFKHKSNGIYLPFVCYLNAPNESLSNYGATACQGLAPPHYLSAKGALLPPG